MYFITDWLTSKLSIQNMILFVLSLIIYEFLLENMIFFFNISFDCYCTRIRYKHKHIILYILKHYQIKLFNVSYDIKKLKMFKITDTIVYFKTKLIMTKYEILIRISYICFLNRCMSTIDIMKNI